MQRPTVRKVLSLALVLSFGLLLATSTRPITARELKSAKVTSANVAGFYSESSSSPGQVTALAVARA
ncbi:MAG: hypothetical protein WCF57_22815, partial [Pyrinomonadaceae bacterium]